MEATAMIVTRIITKEALVEIERWKKRILRNMKVRKPILEIRKR
jgi:hypothetical protein